MSNTKFNITLARAYKTKRGYWSIDITAEEYDAIQKIQMGGRLILKEIPEESRKNDKSPQAYFEYMQPHEVKQFKEKSKKDYKTFSDDYDDL